jgi:hypothetical protein
MLKATVELDRVSEPSEAWNGLSPETVAETLLNLYGARDVTLTITPEGSDERLMVAIDGSRAFLGLERTDGLLQFAVSGDKREELRAFSVGGQESEIEDRYLPEISVAAIVVKEWLEGGEASSQGHWDRQ